MKSGDWLLWCILGAVNRHIKWFARKPANQDEPWSAAVDTCNSVHWEVAFKTL